MILQKMLLVNIQIKLNVLSIFEFIYIEIQFLFQINFLNYIFITVRTDVENIFKTTIVKKF